MFCSGTTYFPGCGNIFNPVTEIPTEPLGLDRSCPPEWVAVKGDHVATPVFGIIRNAYTADIDNSFTHEHTFGDCPYFPDTVEGASLPIPGYFTCPSDFEFEVIPVGPQPGAAPFPGLFGKENKDWIKVEYELYYAAEAHNFLRHPDRGDLVYATGRWIVDCGHESYKSELHPIFSFATMKTVVSETNGFTKLEDDLGIGGRPATRVAIWVNGWYPGGEDNAIEFDAFPPPRPNPDAVLHVIKPVDRIAGDSSYRAAEDVTLEFNFAPPGAANHVHLKFTAPRRENHVTGAGEMKFESGRQYWGIWYLYWGD
jgi:hypothetical protein